MAITVNLLPSDQIASGTLGKLMRGAKSITTGAILIFIIFAIGLGLFIYFQNRRLTEITSANEDLKSEIASLQVSEQQIVLVKDRVKKIETVRTIPSSNKNLLAAESLISTLPEGAFVTDLDMDSKKVDLSVNFKSNGDMNDFMQNLKTFDLFKTITLSAFGYSPTAGYLISLNFGGL